MRRFKTISIAFGLFLAFAQQAPAGEEQTPGEFLEGLYTPYRLGSLQGAPYRADDYRRYFSPALASLLIDEWTRSQQNNEAPLLNGDPFVDTQEWQISDLDIAVGETGPDRAIARVGFKNMGRPKTVTMDLVRAGDGWKIDNINWSEASLRGLFAD